MCIFFLQITDHISQRIIVWFPVSNSSEKLQSSQSEVTDLLYERKILSELILIIKEMNLKLKTLY